MNIPGFTAEASLPRTTEHYNASAIGSFPLSPAVLPQRSRSCVRGCNHADDKCTGSDDACVRSYIDCVNGC